MDPVVGPDRGQRDRETIGVTGLDQEPGRADQLGEWPDRGCDDRDTTGQCLDGRQAGCLRDDRQDGPACATDQVDQVGRGEGRRIHERIADPLPGGSPGDRRPIVRAGPDDEDARRPRHVPGQALGTARVLERGQRREQRGEVESCVEPAGEDEIAAVEAEPIPDSRPGAERASAVTVVGLGREPGPRSQGHDVEPVAPETQEPARCLGRRRAADDDGSRLTQQLGPQALPEPIHDRASERLRHLPRRKVEEGDHDRDARRDRQRAAPDRVVHRSGGTAPLGTPGRPDGCAAEHERIHGHRAGTQQAGRWQLAPADDLEMAEPVGGVVEVRGDQEGERFPGQGIGVVRAEQAIEIGGGQGRAVRRLERPRVEHDTDTCRAIRSAAAEPVRRVRCHGRLNPRDVDATSARGCPRHGAGPRRPAPRRRSGGSSWTDRRVDRGR